jgi:protein TonB
LQTKDVVLSSIGAINTTPPPPPPAPEKQEIKTSAPPSQEKQATKKAAKAIKPVVTKPGIAGSEIKRTKFTTPIITNDADAEPILTLDEDAVIDNINVDGVVGPQILGTALSTAGESDAGEGSGIGEVPAKPNNEDKNKVFNKVEIEASVDIVSWRKHLEQNLVRYINDAANVGMQPGHYTVTVRFLVERDGSIKDVSALNDPGFGLARGATEVVKSGPRWNPGEQNGSKVRSYHTQKITFVIVDG